MLPGKGHGSAVNNWLKVNPFISPGTFITKEIEVGGERKILTEREQF